jgi:hypothetical protein
MYAAYLIQEKMNVHFQSVCVVEVIICICISDLVSFAPYMYAGFEYHARVLF